MTRPFRLLIAFGLMAVATLIPDKQAAAESPTAAPVTGNAPSNAPRILSLHGGKFSIDLSRYPVSGSVRAKNVVVIISDFTCPHSRETEKAFIDALNGFKPGDVALVHLPGAREKKDGPSIHKIMLSLWQDHPAIYRRLSAQMIYEDLPGEPEKVRAAAAAAVGGPAVLDALLKKHSVESEAQIELTSRLMTANADSPASVALPQTMIGQKLITGSILNPAELQTNIQEQFGIAPVHLVYTPQQLPTNPDDPCEPTNRQTCGRLVISMVGAGESRTKPDQSIDASVPGNRHGRDAKNHLLQFTANSNARLPSTHIVLTSDPELKVWLSKLPFTANASLAGIVDASLPAFQRMVSPDTESPLNRALKSFEANEGCKKLMNGGRSVLSYLKVDIVVDGELGSGADMGYYGISVWQKEGTVGTFEKWMKEGTVLGRVEISQLMQRLSGSLIHVFVKPCKAALIGNIFDAASDDAGSCGCALSKSDTVQDNFSGGKGIGSTFNYAMPDKGRDYGRIKSSKAFGRWAMNNATLLNIIPSLLDHEQALIMTAVEIDSEDFILRDIVTSQKNPLFRFGYTSADAVTTELLGLLGSNSDTTAAAKAIADAEFTFEITQLHLSQLTPHEPFSRLDADVARIKERLNDSKKQLRSMVDEEPRTKLDAAVYSMGIEHFNACLAHTGPVSESCSTVKALFDGIKEKVKKNALLSPDEELFRACWNKFTNRLEPIGFKSLWPRYVAGEINAKECSKNMGEAKLAFLEFKRGVEPLYGVAGHSNLNQREKETRENRRKAFTYMNDSLEVAFDSAKSQFFDQLKKESITTKLLKTDAAVDLLAANIDSISDPNKRLIASSSQIGEAQKLIARLASKLNCLTRYKVGPAHDQQAAGPIILYQARK